MDTQAPDDLADDDTVIAHRARAASVLDQIARQTKQTLVAAGVEIDVFFLIPSSGGAIIIYGTPGDPSDAAWAQVGEIVAGIVVGLVGLGRTRRREIQCATT